MQCRKQKSEKRALDGDESCCDQRGMNESIVQTRGIDVIANDNFNGSFVQQKKATKDALYLVFSSSHDKP